VDKSISSDRWQEKAVLFDRPQPDASQALLDLTPGSIEFNFNTNHPTG
jgi:hypothetical protein